MITIRDVDSYDENKLRSISNDYTSDIEYVRYFVLTMYKTNNLLYDHEKRLVELDYFKDLYTMRYDELHEIYVDIVDTNDSSNINDKYMMILIIMSIKYVNSDALFLLGYYCELSNLIFIYELLKEYSLDLILFSEGLIESDSTDNVDKVETLITYVSPKSTDDEEYDVRNFLASSYYTIKRKNVLPTLSSFIVNLIESSTNDEIIDYYHDTSLTDIFNTQDVLDVLREKVGYIKNNNTDNITNIEDFQDFIDIVESNRCFNERGEKCEIELISTRLKRGKFKYLTNKYIQYTDDCILLCKSAAESKSIDTILYLLDHIKMSISNMDQYSYIASYTVGDLDYYSTVLLILTNRLPNTTNSTFNNNNNIFGVNESTLSMNTDNSIIGNKSINVQYGDNTNNTNSKESNEVSNITNIIDNTNTNYGYPYISNDQSMIYRLVEKLNVDIVLKQVIVKGLNITDYVSDVQIEEYKNYILAYYCEVGDYRSYKLLLRNESSHIDDLYASVRSGNTTLIKYIIERMKNGIDDTDELLKIAYYNNRIQAFLLLLNMFSINRDTKEEILKASINDDNIEVQEILT